MKGYPVIDGVTKLEEVSFARFYDQGCSYHSFAVGNNPLSPDAMHPMHMIMTTKYNVSLNSLVFYYEPDLEWIVQEVILCSYTNYLVYSQYRMFRTVWIWTVTVQSTL